MLRGNKVVWIVTYNYGAIKAGPVIRFMRYAPLFEAAGYELLFVTRLREGESKRMENEDGIKSLHIPCSSSVELCKKALSMALAEEQKPANIIFLSLSYKNYTHFKKAVKNGVRCIYVSTMQLDLLNNAGSKRSWIRRKVLIRVLRQLYGLMDTIVTSTAELKEGFYKLGIPESKLKVIYNGVDVAMFAPVSELEKQEYRRQLNLPSDCIILLFVGLFVDRKGVSDLVKMFRICQNQTTEKIRLLMVGHEMEMDEDSEEFKKEWPHIKQEALDEGWLMIHPFSKTIDLYYKASDAFIFMSKLEGMPNVMLESMATGLPVLTTRFNGFGEAYGNESEHYILLKREVDNDAKEILNLISNPENADKLGQNARKLAESKFALSKSIKDYCKIFEG